MKFVVFVLGCIVGSFSTALAQDCPIIDGKLRPSLNEFVMGEGPGRSANIAAPIGTEVFSISEGVEAISKILFKVNSYCSK